MYKLVIVEDEKSIFYLLNSSIMYEELGLVLAGHADDGREGLNMIIREQPDIVITDITMPLMDGLELIEETAKRKLPSRFIIVSGYAQFEFAQKAVTLGVKDYLLKPINAEELNRSLAKLIAEISDGNESVYSFADSGAAGKLRKSWMMSLLHHEAEAAERDLEEVNRDYLYSFTDGVFRMAEIHIDYRADIVVGVQRHIAEILEDLLAKALRNSCSEYQTVAYRDSIFALLNGTEEELEISRLKSLLESVLESAAHETGEYAEAYFTASVGYAVPDIREVLRSVYSAESAMGGRIVAGTGKVLLPAEPTADAASYRIPPDLYGKIGEAVECDRAEELESLIRETLKDVLSFCAGTGAAADAVLEKAFFRMLNLIREKGNYPDALVSLYRKYADEAKACFRAEDLLRRMPEKILSDILAIQKENSSETSGIMRRVLSFIGENYQKQIRLEDAAEQVYMSPTYLGVLFKKETGENFSVYLTNLRIQKAKELLLDERLNIGEIGYMIGYGNSRYFSRIFKENVGITPKEYRRIHAGRHY